MKRSKIISIISFIIFLISLIGYCFNNESYAYKDYPDILRVSYINVGQGDSIFIQLPNSQTMLIDAGEISYGSTVVSYINGLNYSKIDYVIGTHPHSDHIGGLPLVIDSFDIGSIYMPKITTNTNIYENLLKIISNKKLKINIAKNGIAIINNEELKINIIAPNNENYSNLNNYSAVIKIMYGKTSFLFMGDAEIESENEIKSIVNADVIKIGHHGSNTSSGIDFINKVGAKYGIISVGKDNIYLLPSDKIIKNWEQSGARIYRTDIDGTIVVTSDGNTIKVEE